MKKIIRLTESDLVRLIKETIQNNKKLINEEIIGGVSVEIEGGKLKIDGCKYSIDTIFGSPGWFHSISTKGDQIEIKFDNKQETADKTKVESLIQQLRGCPSSKTIEYPIDYFPDIDITFNKVK